MLLKASVNTVIAANKASQIINKATTSANNSIELGNVKQTEVQIAAPAKVVAKEAIEEQQPPPKVQSTSIYDITPNDAPAKTVPTKPAVNAALLRRKSSSTVNQHAVASYITATGNSKSSDTDRFIKKKLHHKEDVDHLGTIDEQGIYELYTVPTANGKSESSGTVLDRKGSVSWRNRIPNPSSK